MKKTIKIAILLICLSLTGCIRVHTVLTVNKDGSGTIQETIMMSKVFSDMMNSFSSFGEEEDAQPFNLFDEEKLRTEVPGFGDGVQYLSGKKVKEKGWEGYTATYTFTDITKVKLSMDQDKKVDTGMGPSDPEEDGESEFYYFSFNRGNTPELIINRREINEPKQPEETNDEAMEELGDENSGMDRMTREMMSMFEGMRFDISVVVDGKVTETNATYASGSTITLLDMDFEKMMKNKSAFMDMTRQKPETTEDMKGFIDKMDGMKLELGQPVVVKFQ